jgi:hypothetical protein
MHRVLCVHGHSAGGTQTQSPTWNPRLLQQVRRKLEGGDHMCKPGGLHISHGLKVKWCYRIPPALLCSFSYDVDGPLDSLNHTVGEHIDECLKLAGCKIPLLGWEIPQPLHHSFKVNGDSKENQDVYMYTGRATISCAGLVVQEWVLQPKREEAYCAPLLIPLVLAVAKHEQHRVQCPLSQIVVGEGRSGDPV